MRSLTTWWDVALDVVPLRQSDLVAGVARGLGGFHRGAEGRASVEARLAKRGPKVVDGARLPTDRRTRHVIAARPVHSRSDLVLFDAFEEDG